MSDGITDAYRSGMITTKWSDGKASDEPVVTPLAVTGHQRGKKSYSGNVLPGHIPKSWGEERIYQNNDSYCCKLLVIEPGKQTSMHFHLDKHETMLVVEGQLAIDYIVNKKKETYIVNKWQAFTIAPGLPHSLRALEEEVRLVESSTPSYDEDSIRIG